MFFKCTEHFLKEMRALPVHFLEESSRTRRKAFPRPPGASLLLAADFIRSADFRRSAGRGGEGEGEGKCKCQTKCKGEGEEQNDYT